MLFSLVQFPKFTCLYIPPTEPFFPQILSELVLTPILHHSPWSGLFFSQHPPHLQKIPSVPMVPGPRVFLSSPDLLSVGCPSSWGSTGKAVLSSHFLCHRKWNPWLKSIPLTPGTVVRMEQAKSKAGPWHIQLLTSGYSLLTCGSRFFKGLKAE